MRYNRENTSVDSLFKPDEIYRLVKRVRKDGKEESNTFWIYYMQPVLPDVKRNCKAYEEKEQTDKYDMICFNFRISSNRLKWEILNEDITVISGEECSCLREGGSAHTSEVVSCIKEDGIIKIETADSFYEFVRDDRYISVRNLERVKPDGADFEVTYTYVRKEDRK